MQTASEIQIEQNVITDIHDQSEDNQYLTFFLQDEVYAFAILHVKEIIEYRSVTKVPMMPAFIQGVINLRGEVVPVINLSLRFDLTESEITKRTCIVIVEVEHDAQKQVLGVMVDSVCEVLDILPENVKETPDFGVHIRTDFIRGMGEINDKFIIILAEDRVLSVDELAMLENLNEQLDSEV